MNREALFCDGTQDYVIPAEPKENEKIKIRSVSYTHLTLPTICSV